MDVWVDLYKLLPAPKNGKVPGGATCNASEKNLTRANFR